MDVSDFLVFDNPVVMAAYAKFMGRVERGENLQTFDAMREGIIAGYEAALRDNGLPPLTNKYVEGLDERIRQRESGKSAG